MWYFTADLHFDHANIIHEFQFRPFQNSIEMNEAIIETWNRTVKGGDVVVIAGDITLKWKRVDVERKFLSRLNGNLIVVRGNHDYWFKGGRYMYRKRVNGRPIIVSHEPMLTWSGKQYGAWNLHGHSHGNLKGYRQFRWRQFDVGIDVAYVMLGEFRPFSFDELEYMIEGGK